MRSVCLVWRPVTQHQTLHVRRCNSKLERSVEVVLLLLRPVHNFASAHDTEATVTKIGGVDGTLLTMQRHDARRATSCTDNDNLCYRQCHEAAASISIRKQASLAAS